MSQSLAAVYIHVVFSTKNRHPFLRDPFVREKTHKGLGALAQQVGCQPIAIGGVEDHVHLLLRLTPTTALANLIRDLKSKSTKWLKARQGNLSVFSWQSGYGAFSVSAGELGEVISYIASQEEHHRSFSFQDEFRKICAECGVELDERYAWT